MDNQLFITAMTMYIVFSMLALVLAIVSKNISKKYIYLVGGVHIICLLLFFVFNNLLNLVSNYNSYFFIIYFCSGLILFGLCIRKNINIFIKLYSALFIGSILVFVVKPSRVLTFITQTPWPHEKIIEYKLDDNLYLIGQSPLLTNDKQIQQYKVIRKLGNFHRTMARDIEFGKNFDSVQVVSNNDSILIINTFDRLTNSKTNSDFLINLKTLKKRDNANI